MSIRLNYQSVEIINIIFGRYLMHLTYNLDHWLRIITNKFWNSVMSLDSIIYIINFLRILALDQFGYINIERLKRRKGKVY